MISRKKLHLNFLYFPALTQLQDHLGLYQPAIKEDKHTISRKNEKKTSQTFNFTKKIVNYFFHEINIFLKESKQTSFSGGAFLVGLGDI